MIPKIRLPLVRLRKWKWRPLPVVVFRPMHQAQTRSGELNAKGWFRIGTAGRAHGLADWRNPKASREVGASIGELDAALDGVRPCFRIVQSCAIAVDEYPARTARERRADLPRLAVLPEFERILAWMWNRPVSMVVARRSRQQARKPQHQLPLDRRFGIVVGDDGGLERLVSPFQSVAGSPRETRTCRGSVNEARTPLRGRLRGFVRGTRHRRHIAPEFSTPRAREGAPPACRLLR